MHDSSEFYFIKISTKETQLQERVVCTCNPIGITNQIAQLVSFLWLNNRFGVQSPPTLKIDW